MSWIRLRQVALVAHDLDQVVGDLHGAFGLEVAFHDPGVATFGLRNAVLPVGHQFIEVVSPTTGGTAGGRQLERLGGDGGYMVICHTDDQASVRDRLGPLGVRTAFEHEDHGYLIMQLHPADTGGSFLEIDFQPGGEDPDGPWTPAGADWQRARRTDIVDGIAGVVVQCRDPEATAARWSAITGCELVGGVLQFDNATVEFREGPVDALVAVTLTATDPVALGQQHTICGVDFTLA
ncbi:VOC family protein [Ilumatobacter nonamiensis]|uniref:VOC family protein n=1 Tax=Ilumatobacter nonamiensis TaxID=467093 RepID=UPI000684367D|nr:VOC family protein [Ilumatobacter nonamiensis]